MALADNAQDIAFLHDDEVFTVDLHLGAGPFAEQDFVAGLDVERRDRAVVGASAGAGAKSEEGKITPLDVKAGDRILFGKWSGTEVKIEGEDLIIMKESDILGIVG